MGRIRRMQIMRSILGAIILLVFLFPIYWMINAAFQGANSSAEITFIPSKFSGELFIQAFHDQAHNLLTSLIISLGATFVSLLVSTPAGYALSRLRIRRAPIILFVLLISQMIPGIVIANALYSAYGSLNLLNSHLGLVLADASLGIPFSVLIIRSFMLGIPEAVLDAAKVDGAGTMRIFITIVTPIAKNGIITAGLFSFLFAWSDFLFSLTLTTTPRVRPITLGIYQYLGAHVSNWGSVMAAAVLASIPAGVLLIVAQRYLAAGVTGGAVK